MRATNAPLHIQFLQYLRRRVIERRTQLCDRTGTGLEDREYQRHVGRIKECAVTLEEIDKLLKAGVDGLDEEEDQREQNKQRTARRTRQTQ